MTEREAQNDKKRVRMTDGDSEGQRGTQNDKEGLRRTKRDSERQLFFVSLTLNAVKEKGLKRSK
jgi:hypothetical protein